MATKTETFKNMNGQRVIRTVHGLPTVDDIEAIRNRIIADVAAYNKCTGENLTVTEDINAITVGSQFIMKPKLVNNVTGTISIRSSDYSFFADNADCPSYGGKKDLIPDEDGRGFTLPVGSGSIRYRLI